MKCSNCGEEISDGIKFCPNCGENLEKQKTPDSVVDLEKPKCPDCGHEITDAVTFCPNCGCNLKVSAGGSDESDHLDVNASQKEDDGIIILTNANSESNSSQNNGSKFNSTQNNSAKNQKKSLSDIPEDFKNASTGKKILAVLLCCCVGLAIFGAIGGLIFPDSNTSDDYDYDDDILSSGSSGFDDGIGDSDIQIRITCDCDWHGRVGVGSSQASYSGSGDKLINLDGDSSEIVAAVVQKQDSGNGKLKVEIIKDGKVVKDASTTSEYGVVSLAD